MKKRGISLVLAVVLLLAATGTITSFADNTLTVGVQKTVTVPAGEYLELSFTPDATGVYLIQSFADGCDPDADLYLDDYPVAFHDDCYYEESDAANADYNFFISAILEAGETYTLFIEEFEGKKATFDVLVTFYTVVTDVAFTPAKAYEYIDKTDVFEFDFNQGDKLTVTTDAKTFTFWYNSQKGDFFDADGDPLYSTFSTVVLLTPLFDGDEYNESAFRNKAEVSFFHYTFECNVVTKQNPLQSVAYQLKTPYILVKNLNGGWEYDKNGNKYYCYYIDFLAEGDVLTLKYNNGKSKKFTCHITPVVDDEYGDYWDIAFTAKDGTVLDNRYLLYDCYETQYNKPWQLGTNYITVTYMGKSCKVPVEVINPGWYVDGGKWYYYSKTDGEKVTGWQKIDSKWYWFSGAGVMQTGWKKLGGKWYYFNASGAMLTGWQKLGGKWYYFNTSGAMLTGWQRLGGKWYYFNASGAMLTSWQKLDGSWYYFNSGGDMKTGWLQSGGKWYYLKSSGAMATGRLIIGGKTYYFNSSGVCTNP